MKKQKILLVIIALVSAMLLTLVSCNSGSKTEQTSEREQTTEWEQTSEREQVTRDEAEYENTTSEETQSSDPLYEYMNVTVNENGVAIWEIVEGAVGYEYTFVYRQEDGTPVIAYQTIANVISTRIPEGYWLEIRPVFQDGQIGIWTQTEIFGNPENRRDLESDGSSPDREAPRFLWNEDGCVTWEAIDGAERYDCHIVYLMEDDILVAAHHESVDHPISVKMQDGYAIKVYAHFPDGTFSVSTSEIYGDPSKRTMLLFGQIERDYSTRWEDLKTYELISHIDYSSVITAEDGSVTFNATDPKGDTMRFYGRGIRVGEDRITMMPGSFLTALDAIGRIFVYRTVTDKPITDEGDDQRFVRTGGGYTLSEETHVDSYVDLTYVMGDANYTTGNSGVFVDDGKAGESTGKSTWHYETMYQPNFISLNGSSYETENFNLFELYVYYDEVYTTEVEYVKLNADFYSAYLENEFYNVARETESLGGVPAFYLVVKLKHDNYIGEEYSYEEWADLPHSNGLYTISSNLYEIGDLRDASGNVVDKETTRLTVGMTLDLTIGDRQVDLPLTILPWHNDASVMHDLVPYAFPEAIGTLNTLVIPIGWNDEPQHADDDEYARFRSELGRVMDENGNVTDYSFDHTIEKRFSLSEYYDIASLGKLKVQSFMTDWYRVPYNFSEMKDRNPDLPFMEELSEWLYATYPDMDWTRFDQDANGYFDAVVLLNAGEVEGSFHIISFGGGIMTRNTYTGEFAGTPERPGFNCYTSMNAHLFSENTLIHEFAHNLGLIDYYDVRYSGIDAVGKFDMQSASHGDWNAYSKYAVGWIEPEIVTGLNKGESVEIEIGALTQTGDAIVIPAATSNYNGTPFDEYILIDLFADDGVNVYDSSEFYGLEGAVGVRIYHVNARMEKRILKVEGHDREYPIGTVHFANSYTEDGMYHLELIQSSGNNTFTDLSDLDPVLSSDDLFAQGDVFTVEDYAEFFSNGLMDDGSEFGYTVEIVKLTEGETPSATIRITRQ